jgi:hypothetical protein
MCVKGGGNMAREEIKKLSIKIANRQCVLFAGAGLTSEGGGATWVQLIEYLVKKFNYSSPLKDKFQIVGDICKKNGYDNVYVAIQQRLKQAKIVEPLKKLVSLPWYTTFTTNYDTGLEDALKDTQKLAVKTVLRGDEFSLAGIVSEMLCVKLMGSLDIPPHQPGSMVIDPGDLALADVQRSQNLDLLERHAANLYFLFVGYSFDDGLFIKILEKLNKILGTSPNTHYAIFKDKPDENSLYLLQQNNVEVIIEDLKVFTKEIAEQVSLHNPNDFSLKSFRLGSDIIPVNVLKIGGFLAQYNPVLSENFQEYVNPNSFFKGYTESFNPFELNWHFPRKEIDSIIKAALERPVKVKEASLISVIGNPGSGRTFAILASVHNLITKHKAIAIKIPNYALRPIPSAEEFSIFVDEINKAAGEVGSGSAEHFIFWADYLPNEDIIGQYLKFAHNIDFPTCFIYEDMKPSQIEFSLFRKYNLTTIDMDTDLLSDTKSELISYLINAIQQHKLPEASKVEIESIIATEKMFLSIMYKTLDPARRSINKIVEEELTDITDPDVRTFITICSLATSLNLDIPLVIARGALNILTGKNYVFSDIISILKQKAGAFVKDYEDFRFNWFLSIYHPLIAKHISRIAGTSQMNEILLSIANTADIKGSVEANFIGALLISKGVNSYKRRPLPFNQTGLEAALLKIKTRQPARPILHHLARFYAENDINDTKIIPLLVEALAEPKEKYMLYEKKGNILTSLAKIKWQQQKKDLMKLPSNDPQIQEIMGLLDAARVEETAFAEVYNVHAYDVQARVLNELAQNSKNEITRLSLINRAIEVVSEGLDNYGDDPESGDQLKSLLIELLSEITTLDAENKARELLAQEEGIGYYTLATIEHYKTMDTRKAEQFLELSLSAKNYPASAIVLMLEISLFNNPSPDYKKLLKLVTLLSSRQDFHDNWKTMFYKGFIYAVNGEFQEANKLFHIANRKAPFYLQRKVQLFWIENGRRKVFQGKVSRPLTEREGRIYSHNISGCFDDIYFDPRKQAERQVVKPGLAVIFELGFSPKGPIAFDVRPH